MSKATHNGTCQACGRSHAVSPILAAHGYTVKWGFFSGTCAGSNYLPLEQDTSFNEKVVRSIRDWADAQEAKAAGEILTITVRTKNPDYVRGGIGIQSSKTIDTETTRDEFIAASRADWQSDDQPRWDEFHGSKFDKEVENIRYRLNDSAKRARIESDDLEQLASKTFGKDLTPRCLEVKDTPVRKYFNSRREAYHAQAELTEKGIKSTVRSNRYGEVTLSYRK